MAKKQDPPKSKSTPETSETPKSGVKKVFGVILRGVARFGKAIADFADIPFAKELVAVIPVVGPALAIALRFVDEAEEKFRDQSKSGADKRAFALALIESALATAGLDSGRARALLELAVLIQSNEAFLHDVVEGVEEVVKPQRFPRGASA